MLNAITVAEIMYQVRRLEGFNVSVSDVRGRPLPSHALIAITNQEYSTVFDKPAPGTDTASGWARNRWFAVTGFGATVLTYGGEPASNSALLREVRATYEDPNK